MRTLSRFNHRGIVVFHHHFTHESELILVMEYCAGGSLDRRLFSSGSVSQDEVFRWGAVLCDTLGFVHGKGIVHHDIKPANILFALDGSIKLGDFGIANRNAGTRLYLPPEMLLGESVSRTDPRVDIYALGLTLLEALVGVHPFASLTQDEAFRARITQDFIPSHLPRWVQELLLRATHPTPELRFQQVADFAEAINAKHVPYVFDGHRIKAHALAERSEAKLARKNWKAAEKLADHALRICPDSATALVAAGRCQLLLRRTDKAKDNFMRALAINPRIHVQKELGWLNLEEGHIPIAISLLSDHLDRSGSDFEGFNLLLKCFFLSGRFEAGEELARVVMKEKAGNDCFRNNRFLCRLLSNGYSDEELSTTDIGDVVNPFIAYNLIVARETPRSWVGVGQPALRDKLVFQEYRFGLGNSADKTNPITIRLPDSTLRETDAPLVSVGSLGVNDVVLRHGSVSRRHAVIVNLPNEVWLYDLGSTCGSRIDERAVSGRVFLDGVHRITLGHVEIEVAASAGLLV